LQAVAKRRNGKIRVVFEPRKPLFLGRGHQATVLQQTAGRLMIESGNADDVHWTKKFIRQDPVILRRAATTYNR